MTDAEFKKQRKRVRRLAARWHTTLGLRWWKVDYVNYRGPIEGHEGAVGTASVKWEYGQASICFDLERVSKLTDPELENCFVHECSHILVAEMREWDGGDRCCPVKLRHEERVVSQLASAFLWTREAGASDEKKRRKKPKGDS